MVGREVQVAQQGEGLLEGAAGAGVGVSDRCDSDLGRRGRELLPSSKEEREGERGERSRSSAWGTQGGGDGILRCTILMWPVGQGLHIRV